MDTSDGGGWQSSVAEVYLRRRSLHWARRRGDLFYGLAQEFNYIHSNPASMAEASHLRPGVADACWVAGRDHWLGRVNQRLCPRWVRRFYDWPSLVPFPAASRSWIVSRRVTT